MAGEKAGKDLLLKVETSTGVFTTLGGLRSKSFSLSADGIDVTNHGSNQQRTYLDNAGIVGGSLSGSGVTVDDATYDVVEANFLSQTLTRFQIIEDNTGKSYTAYCKITSLERSAEYNGEDTYSISLETSGAITISS